MKNLLDLRLEDDPRRLDAPALCTRHANAEGQVRAEAVFHQGAVTTRQLASWPAGSTPTASSSAKPVENDTYDRVAVEGLGK